MSCYKQLFSNGVFIVLSKASFSNGIWNGLSMAFYSTFADQKDFEMANAFPYNLCGYALLIHATKLVRY